MIRSFDAADLVRALPTRRLVEALREAFRGDARTPTRHHHRMAVPGGPEATLLLMPSWIEGRYAGVKIVSVFPGNAARGRDSVQGSYVLMSAQTGEPLAILDGRMLTLRRTACASALAATYLARADASRLLMIGTGALSPHLIEAHAAIRPIREIAVWGRDRSKAEAVAATLTRDGLPVVATGDLEQAVRAADIVSCATLSKTPLVRGAWLRPGQHVDLVGSYAPDMREADDEAVARARVYIDTAAAIHESGDLGQPIASGILAEERISGDLAKLATGAAAGRSSDDEITLFKSAGTAIEDLAAAILVYEGQQGQGEQTA
jgi:ornithine cyclodeaminase